MADDNPEQIQRAEESKKDTVRINLPPGLTGRGAPAPPGVTSPPPPKPKTPGPPVNPEEEAKKETAVMGRPAEAPKPKKDTSRVQVTAAKPAAPETPRPTVKLRREDEAAPPAAPPAAPATPGLKAAPAPRTVGVPKLAAPAMASAPSGAEVALSLVALVLSLAVAGYLAFITFG
jgi:translation initiation factor IF-2